MTDKKKHVYAGERPGLGQCKVTVDGEPLQHVIHHSPDGFEWGYGGSGPADLSLSILAHHFGETPTKEQIEWGWCLCWLYHQDFKWQFVARIEGDQWIIHTSLVQAILRLIDKEHKDQWQRQKARIIAYPDMDEYETN